jgi:cardiolipin synthase
VLILESRPGRGYRETAACLAAVVAAARESVWISNAYFAPGHLVVAGLGRAAARGVDVRLLLPGRTDAPLVRHAGHGYYSRLLKRGVRIFEYQPAILHAKTLVADRYVSLVGSTNLDFRSFRFNAECNALVLDAELGDRLAGVYEADLEESVEISLPQWVRRSRWHRLFDRLAASLAPLL